MLEKITSIKDERIILARSLNSHKGRQAQNKILLEGEQIITGRWSKTFPSILSCRWRNISRYTGKTDLPPLSRLSRFGRDH
jgi:hypothetical protein